MDFRVTAGWVVVFAGLQCAQPPAFAVEYEKQAQQTPASSKGPLDLFLKSQELKERAEQGEAYAQNQLGIMNRDGLGVEQDFEEAMRWFQKAADQHDASAFINIGFMYGNGQGVARDYDEEMRWIRKAADAGDPVGQYDLGVMISEARRTKDCDEEATPWIQKAAQQGHPPALRELGLRYVKGRGIPRDDHAAYYCLYLSSLLGEKPGLALLSAQRRLTKEEVFKIQGEARDWVGKNVPQEESSGDVHGSTGTPHISAAASSGVQPSTASAQTVIAPPGPIDPTARPSGY
jgi:TPR repeat protein